MICMILRLVSLFNLYKAVSKILDFKFVSICLEKATPEHQKSEDVEKHEGTFS